MTNAFYISAVGNSGDRFYASATFPQFKPIDGAFDKYAPRLHMTNYLIEAMPYPDKAEAERDLVAYRSAHPDLSNWTLASE